MLNQVVCVGRLVNNLKVEELEGKKVSYITLAVPRSYKNADGVYETDFIDCTLWNGIAENTAEYCKKGDLVGVKGRIQTEIIDDKKVMRVICERLSPLSSGRTENEE